MKVKHKIMKAVGWLIMAIVLMAIGFIQGELFWIIIGIWCFFVWMHSNNLIGNSWRRNEITKG